MKVILKIVGTFFWFVFCGNFIRGFGSVARRGTTQVVGWIVIAIMIYGIYWIWKKPNNGSNSPTQ